MHRHDTPADGNPRTGPVLDRLLARYGESGLIRVDSIPEAYAVLDAYPSEHGSWDVRAELRSSRDQGRTLTLDIVDSQGRQRAVRFDGSGFAASGGIRRAGSDPTEALDRLMLRATEFAAENPPHHPGSLARFPIPSRRYTGRVEVPMAVLAVDDHGKPGLFAPPRVVTVGIEDAEPHGVGEFPGFDPESWPPPKLGAWPPPGARGLERSVLSGMVRRMSAVWFRLMLAWMSEANDYLQRAAEAAEALDLLAYLDLPGMAPYYTRLNPPFWRWLESSATEAAATTA